MNTSRVPSNSELHAVVKYRMREYMSVVCDHAVTQLEQAAITKGKRPSAWSLLAVRAILLLVLPFVFWFKTSRVGTCEFTIGELGLQRKCKAGTTTVEWHHVTAVHRHSQAYLVVTAAGGYPLPYRCFPGEHVQTLAGYLARHSQFNAGA